MSVVLKFRKTIGGGVGIERICNVSFSCPYPLLSYFKFNYFQFLNQTNDCDNFVKIKSQKSSQTCCKSCSNELVGSKLEVETNIGFDEQGDGFEIELFCAAAVKVTNLDKNERSMKRKESILDSELLGDCRSTILDDQSILFETENDENGYKSNSYCLAMMECPALTGTIIQFQNYSVDPFYSAQLEIDSCLTADCTELEKIQYFNQKQILQESNQQLIVPHQRVRILLKTDN